MTRSNGWLRSSEAAILLCVSKETIVRWAKTGKLPVQRTLGGHLRFRRAEVEELVDSLRVEIQEASE